MVLDLFSGIGGFSLGLHWAGFRTGAFCEQDPFCRRVLERHWPDVPVYPDVRELTGERLRGDGVRPDLVCGGFPCQDASLAGRGAGMAGARTGLWREMARIVGECRPGWVVAENVPGLRSRGADTVLADLEALGYRSWPLVVGAVHAGAPHLRRRVWVVGQRIAADPHGTGLEVRQHRPARPTPRLPVERRGRWPPQPGLPRVDDGFPGRVDRVRALGNAVVPANAAMIGRAITLLDDAPKLVLIVEDEALVALTIEDVLTEAGYQVCGIADAPGPALALARKHRPDLAVVDVRLAAGGDGIALAAQMLELGPIRILYATGNAGEVRQRARVGHGCLSKPFEPEWLVAALHAVQGGPARGIPGFLALPLGKP